MTPEQYDLIKPYLKHIELEYCNQQSCNELANIHEALGYGPINRTCGGCVTQMLKTLKAHKDEYEASLPNR